MYLQRHSTWDRSTAWDITPAWLYPVIPPSTLTYEAYLGFPLNNDGTTLDLLGVSSFKVKVRTRLHTASASGVSFGFAFPAIHFN